MAAPKSQFILFSQTTKTSLFVSLAPFFVFRGPNLSAVNYQSPGKKTSEKIKPTLFCRHYVMDITLWTQCYGNDIIDIMTE